MEKSIGVIILVVIIGGLLNFGVLSFNVVLGLLAFIGIGFVFLDIGRSLIIKAPSIITAIVCLAACAIAMIALYFIILFMGWWFIAGLPVIGFCIYRIIAYANKPKIDWSTIDDMESREWAEAEIRKWRERWNIR